MERAGKVKCAGGKLPTLVAASSSYREIFKAQKLRDRDGETITCCVGLVLETLRCPKESLFHPRVDLFAHVAGVGLHAVVWPMNRRIGLGVRPVLSY